MNLICEINDAFAISIGTQLNPARAIDLMMTRIDEEAQKAHHHPVDNELYYDGPKAYVRLLMICIDERVIC